MKDLRNLINPAIRELSPYRSARSEVNSDNYLLLDANESPYGEFNRYPDPLQREVKQAVSRWKNVREDQIFLGNGSDEAIDLLMRVFTRPGSDDQVLVPVPTYGMYKVSAAIQQIDFNTLVLGENFQLEAKSLLDAVTADTRIIILCTPNNPTGNTFSVDEMMKVLKGFKGIVVVDEAYIDFANNPSMLTRLDDYPNLVVLQTFSKAMGMAGTRLGMAFANPLIIEQLNKIKAPYNVNALTQAFALKQLQQESVNNSCIRSIVAEREVLANALHELPAVTKVYPSEANFLLVQFKNAGATYRWLLKNGIVVRNRGKEPGCDGCLRISIGTPEQNRQLLMALEQYAQDEMDNKQKSA